MMADLDRRVAIVTGANWLGPQRLQLFGLRWRPGHVGDFVSSRAKQRYQTQSDDPTGAS